MKLVCLIWERKLKNLRLIASGDFFGLPRIPDNFILSAPPKNFLASSHMSVWNSVDSTDSDMATLIFINTLIKIIKPMIKGC